MKASELIGRLNTAIAAYGDKEVIIRTGLLNDPEFVEAVEAVDAEITQHDRHRSVWIGPWGPKLDDKVFLLTE